MMMMMMKKKKMKKKKKITSGNRITWNAKSRCEDNIKL